MIRPFRLQSRDPSEDEIHEAVAAFLTKALPASVWWSSIEHRNARDKVEGSKRKKRGVKAGVPDVLFCYGRVLMAIELKTRTGSLSKAQIERRAELLAAGAYWALCRSVEDVEVTLRAWGVPLRGSLGRGAHWQDPV